MTDLPRINLADLWQIYLLGTEASQVPAHLQRHGGDDRYMDRLLRHHEEAAVVDPAEIALRRAYDRYLAFCSLLEMASLAGYVPQPKQWPGPERESVGAVLRHPAVRTFYEIHYPLLLPQVLRLRLDGEISLRQEAEAAPLLFMRFLDVNAALRPDREIGTFLDMLDDFSYGPYRLAHLAEVLQTPEQFFDHIARPPEKQTPLEHGLAGLQRFLAFSDRLGRWLDACNELPLLQSAGWHCHEYWFGIVRERLAAVLLGALDEFAAWEQQARERGEDFIVAGPSLEERRANLERLMSDRYRGALMEGAGRGSGAAWL